MTTQVDRQRQAGEWAQRNYVIATNYDGDSGRWHAWAPQFGIRMARGVGGTEEEAKDELRRSLQVVFEGMAEVGEQPAPPVPADKLDLDKDRPLATNLPSGKLVVRLGRELHAALIEGAERNNTSLNNYIVMLLSRQNAFDEIRAVAESA